jgi:two-component sensor histidine kinase
MPNAIASLPPGIPNLGSPAELQRCLRDLIAISTFPAIWIKADDRQIATDLADTFLGMLDLDFACVSLGTGHEPHIEIKRARPGSNRPGGPAFLDGLAARLMPGFYEISDPGGEGVFRIFCVALGNERGITLTAASLRPDFPTESERMLLRVAANEAAVALRRWRGEQELREQTRTLEILNRTGAGLAANLDTRTVAQSVIDAATALTGAALGVFFYDAADPESGRVVQHAFAGTATDVYGAAALRANPVRLREAFDAQQAIRCHDLRTDPHLARGAFLGLAPGDVSIASYLAVPVISRSGEIVGGLFFGHRRPDVFSDAAERIAVGIAGQAAIALDNARLYEEAQRELAYRRHMEEQQNLLLAELSHRVKNTLAIVQSISTQTLRHSESPQAFHAAFEARLAALSHAHTLLTETNWQGASLRALLEQVLQPFGGGRTAQCSLMGEDILIGANEAVAAAMLFHELATNAAKFGALSTPSGQVRIAWQLREEPARLSVYWSESGGPPVTPPPGRGFGMRLIEHGASPGSAQVDFRPEGLVCSFELILHRHGPAALRYGPPLAPHGTRH